MGFDARLEAWELQLIERDCRTFGRLTKELFGTGGIDGSSC